MKNAWNTHRIECFRHFYRHFFCTHLVQIHKPRFSLKTPCLSGIQWSFTICISRIQVLVYRVCSADYNCLFTIQIVNLAILCKQKIREIIFNIDCSTVPCHFVIGRDIERPLFMIPMYAEDRDSRFIKQFFPFSVTLISAIIIQSNIAE